jgi:hypothetical protein
MPSGMATKPTALDDRFTKTRLLDQIAAGTELSRKQMATALDGLAVD